MCVAYRLETAAHHLLAFTTALYITLSSPPLSPALISAPPSAPCPRPPSAPPAAANHHKPSWVLKMLAPRPNTNTILLASVQEYVKPSSEVCIVYWNSYAVHRGVWSNPCCPAPILSGGRVRSAGGRLMLKSDRRLCWYKREISPANSAHSCFTRTAEAFMKSSRDG